MPLEGPARLYCYSFTLRNGLSQIINLSTGILSVFAKLQRATISFVMSVRPTAWNDSAPTGRIFVKFDIWVFYENMSRKFKFYENLTRTTGTLHEDLCTLMIASSWILRRMRSVSEKNCHCQQNKYWKRFLGTATMCSLYCCATYVFDKNVKKQLCLHVKGTMFLSDGKQIRNSSTDFHRSPHY
jgi:hypothetical protein